MKVEIGHIVHLHLALLGAHCASWLEHGALTIGSYISICPDQAEAAPAISTLPYICLDEMSNLRLVLIQMSDALET